ncbi:cytochrome P450 [Fennellomyces sp. T-0311]|nr:cytochrome P450 [Fennellomyces sp. T-0311]
MLNLFTLREIMVLMNVAFHDYSTLVTSALTCCAITLLAYFWVNPASNQKKALDAIPTPKGYPYIGHILCFDKLHAHKLKEWHDELGPVIRVQMGVQPWIVVSDPKIVYELFVLNSSVASNRPYQVLSSHHYSRGRSGIAFGEMSSRWRRLRAAAATSALSPTAVKKFTPMIQAEAGRLVKDLIKACTSQKSIDPLRPLRRAALNYVFQTCYATNIESDDDPRLQSAIEFTDETNMLIGTHKDITGFLPFMTLVNKIMGRKNKLLEDFLRKRDPFLLGMIQQARNSNQDCMMKCLYNQQEELGLKDTDLLVVAGDMIAGAATNVGYGIGWFLAIMLHYPKVYTRLCDEVDSFICEHGRLPLFSEREAFPLLNSVQKECMRYRGTNDVTLPHLIEKDMQCQGYVFPKGVLVLPSAYAMHRDPERYPEPDKFIADRFINDSKSMASSIAGKVEERDHFMFGWGKRTCPAVHLAEVQMFAFLTNIIAECDIETPVDGSLPYLDDAQDAGAVMSPPPFHMRFIRRSNSLLSK